MFLQKMVTRLLTPWLACALSIWGADEQEQPQQNIINEYDQSKHPHINLRDVILSQVDVAEKITAIESYVEFQKATNPDFDVHTFFNFAPVKENPALNKKIGAPEKFDGNMLLHLALGGSWELMKYLLDRPETILDPTGRDSMVVKILYYAIYEKRNDRFANLVNYISQRFPREQALAILETTVMNVTPLHIALGEANEECTAILLDANVNVNIAVQEDGITPIHVAAARGNIKCLRMLLLQTALTIGARTAKTKMTALHYAAFRGNRAVVEMLLTEYGRNFNVNDQSISGMTPLMYAISEAVNGSLQSNELIRTILNLGGDVMRKDRNGNNGFVYALYKGNYDALKTLFEHAETAAKFEEIWEPYHPYLYNNENYLSGFVVASQKSGERQRATMNYLFGLIQDKVKVAMRKANRLPGEEIISLFDAMPALLDEADILKSSVDSLSLQSDNNQTPSLCILADTNLKETTRFELMFALNNVLFQLSNKQLKDLLGADDEYSISSVLNETDNAGVSTIQRIVRQKSKLVDTEQLTRQVTGEFITLWKALPGHIKARFITFHQSWRNHPLVLKYPHMEWLTIIEKVHLYGMISQRFMLKSPQEILHDLRDLFRQGNDYMAVENDVERNLNNNN